MSFNVKGPGAVIPLFRLEYKTSVVCHNVYTQKVKISRRDRLNASFTMIGRSAHKIPMTVKLLWLVKLAEDAAPADQTVSSRLQVIPDCPGRRQLDVFSSPGLR